MKHLQELLLLADALDPAMETRAQAYVSSWAYVNLKDGMSASNALKAMKLNSDNHPVQEKVFKSFDMTDEDAKRLLQQAAEHMGISLRK